MKGKPALKLICIGASGAGKSVFLRRYLKSEDEVVNDTESE